MNPDDLSKLLSFAAGMVLFIPVIAPLAYYYHSVRVVGFFLVIFSIFCSSQKIGILPFGMYELHRGWNSSGFDLIITDYIAIGLILATIWIHRTAGRPLSKLVPPGAVVWGILLCFLVTSVIWSVKPTYSAIGFLFFLRPILIGTCVYLSLYVLRLQKVFIVTLSICMIVVGIVSVYQKYIMGMWSGVSGWTHHKNIHGVMCYMSVAPILGCLVFQHKTPFQMALYSTAVGLGTVGILFTTSRAAAAGLILSVLFVLCASVILLKARLGRGILYLLLIVVGSGVLIKGSGDVIRRFKTVTLGGERDIRYHFDKTAEAMLHDHPWTGVGLGNFSYCASPPFPKYPEIFVGLGGRIINSRTGVVESGWWLLLSEAGYPSMIIMACFYSMFVFWAWRVAWLNRGIEEGWVLIGIACVLTYATWHTTKERIMFTTCQGSGMWFTILAYVSCFERIRRDRNAEHSRLSQITTSK